MTNDIMPTRQAIAAKERSGKLTVSGKLKKALDLMLEGSRRPDAAKAAGMTDHGLREAMKKPHVKQFMRDGLQVLRENEAVRNLLALVNVREGKIGDETHTNPMAVVAAVKAMEQIADAEARPGGGHVQTMPGLVVQINVPTIDRSSPVTVRPLRQADIEPGTEYKIPLRRSE